MDRRTFIAATSALGISSLASDALAVCVQAKGKRVGIVGLDSSHAIAFTKELNANLGTDNYKGYTVVAAYPMGSPGIPLNAKRIPQFTEEIQKIGVKIVYSITQLLQRVDVVLLETNDGNLHLKQAEEIIKARKPLFIDKPIANSYQDAANIFALAEKYNTPVFSTSSLRYIEGLAEIDKKSVLGADIYSPAHLEPSHKDLYWYGIHGVEMLFALLGPECVNVQVTRSDNVDICIGRWAGGKVGVLRGTRNGVDAFGGTVYTADRTITLGAYKGYSPMLKRIIDFYKTGQAPVDVKETLAICKFIDAAYQSRINGGLLTELQ